jgi:hypothetical protein
MLISNNTLTLQSSTLCFRLVQREEYQNQLDILNEGLNLDEHYDRDVVELTVSATYLRAVWKPT